MEQDIKQLLIVLFVATIVVVSIASAVVFRPLAEVEKEYATLPDVSEQPVLGDGNAVPVERLVVSTPLGDVAIADPRSLPETIPLGTGTYLLTGLDEAVSPDFSIIYNEENQSFAISLETEPLAASREAASEYLRDLLGARGERLCAMNIFVSPPYQVNEFYAGQNLGLSFCPYSVRLE